MKKAKYVITIILIVLSFYLTDKAMIYIESKNPIMKVIKDLKDDYYVEPVNAIIKDNTIIPGIKGKEVNEHKSFLNMEDFGSFNDLYLKYNYIYPKISFKDNPDKIIIKGNENKREVSFIINKNDEIKKYFDENNIKYSSLLYITNVIDNKSDYINAENTKNNFSDLHSIMRKNKINTKICLYDVSNYDECLKKKYKIVNYSIDASINILDVLKKINSGDIIYINEKVTLENVKLIINEINKIDLTIVELNSLISE